jgi:Family of unknown function (DUF5906)
MKKNTDIDSNTASVNQPPCLSSSPSIATIDSNIAKNMNYAQLSDIDSDRDFDRAENEGINPAHLIETKPEERRLTKQEAAQAKRGTNKELRDQNEADWEQKLADNEARKAKKEGKPKNKEFKKEDEEKDQVLTRTEIYYAGLDEMQSEVGELDVVFNSKSPFGQMDIGLPEIIKPLKGMEVHGNQYIIQSTDKVNEKLLNAVKESKDLQALHKQAWIDVLEGENGRLSKYAGVAPYIHKVKSVSLTGRNKAWKRLPPLNWFTKKLQKLDARQILAPWNDPEADTLMLHLGKIATGGNALSSTKESWVRTTEYILDEEGFATVLDYKYRVIAVLTGTHGAGKSTFLNNVNNALEWAGYSTAAMSFSNNQFGWGVAGKNDLIFSDDSGKNAFQSFYKSSQLKTIAAGGITSDEPKGKDHRDVKANAGVIICANDIAFDAKDYDKGTEDRFHYLKTKEPSHIMKQLGCDYDSYLKRLCNKYECDRTTLFLYLLRHCLDNFMKTIGYEWRETDPKREIGCYARALENTLHQRLEDNRKKYITQPRIDLPEALTKAQRKVYLFNEWLQSEVNLAGIELNCSDHNDFSFNGFSALQVLSFITPIYNAREELDKRVKKACDKKADFKRIQDELDRVADWVLDHRHFNYGSVAHCAEAVIKAKKDKPTLNGKESLKLIAESLETHGKGNIPKQAEFYQSEFDTWKSCKSELKEELENLMNDISNEAKYILKKIRAYHL